MAKNEMGAAVLLAPSSLQLLRLRKKYILQPNPAEFLVALRAVPPLDMESQPVLALPPGATPSSGGGARKSARSVEVERHPFQPLRRMPSTTPEEFRRKEVAFLARKRQALYTLRDAMWAAGGLVLRQAAAEREWGPVPEEISASVAEGRRNRKDNRLSLKRVWGSWKAPFVQTLMEWDEVYLAAFPEVVDAPERPGSSRWRGFYSHYTRDFVGDPTPHVRQLMGWSGHPIYTRHFAKRANELEDLDVVISEVEARLGRDPSRARELQMDSAPRPRGPRVGRDPTAPVVVESSAEGETPPSSRQPSPEPVRKSRRLGESAPAEKKQTSIKVRATPAEPKRKGGVAPATPSKVSKVAPAERKPREERGPRPRLAEDDDPLVDGFRMLRSHLIAQAISTLNMVKATSKVLAARGRSFDSRDELAELRATLDAAACAAIKDFRLSEASASAETCAAPAQVPRTPVAAAGLGEVKPDPAGVSPELQVLSQRVARLGVEPMEVASSSPTLASAVLNMATALLMAVKAHPTVAGEIKKEIINLFQNPQRLPSMDTLVGDIVQEWGLVQEMFEAEAAVEGAERSALHARGAQVAEPPGSIRAEVGAGSLEEARVPEEERETRSASGMTGMLTEAAAMRMLAEPLDTGGGSRGTSQPSLPGDAGEVARLVGAPEEIPAPPGEVSEPGASAGEPGHSAVLAEQEGGPLTSSGVGAGSERAQAELVGEPAEREAPGEVVRSGAESAASSGIPPGVPAGGGSVGTEAAGAAEARSEKVGVPEAVPGVPEPARVSRPSSPSSRRGAEGKSTSARPTKPKRPRSRTPRPVAARVRDVLDLVAPSSAAPSAEGRPQAGEKSAAESSAEGKEPK